MKIFKVVTTAILACSASVAFAQNLIPEPAPLPEKVILNVGYLKVGHLSPILAVDERLKKMNVEVKRADFVRYADARTALLSNTIDLTAVGPLDLAIAAAQGSKNLVGLTGVASSQKFLVVRKGVKIDTWADIAGKKIAIAPGSAVWFQFAMTLIEKGIPYNSFTAVNVQGGGTAFLQAMGRGDIDAMVLWEPFESQAVAEGMAYFAKGLEYSQSKAVGAELGMIAATRQALDTKREAIKRFLWVYIDEQKKMAADNALFAANYSAYTGLPLTITGPSAEVIRLGGVLDVGQMQRMSEAAFKQGIVPKNVSDQMIELFDTSVVAEITQR